VGAITSCTVMEDKEGRKFCFVNYEQVEDAKKAVEELNGKDMRTDAEKEDGKEESEETTLYVGRAMTKAERAKEMRQAAGASRKGGGEERPGGVNLYVKNLEDDTTDESLKELFEAHGKITSAIAVKDAEGKCKGFGFVCYSSHTEATKAVTEMHLKVVNGKPLYVGLAERKEARSERLRQRYSPGGGKGGKDGKGRGKGMGVMGGGMRPPFPQAGMPMGPGMAMGAPMMGASPGGGMMASGMAPMMMSGKGGMMMNPMMMGKGGPMGMMAGKGPMGMMGGPQMMMGKGAVPPQMMAMMAGKGPMPMPGAMGMPPRPMMAPGQGGPVQVAGQQGLGGPAPAAPLNAPLTAAALAAAPASVQKQMLGEKLFPAISRYQPELAGKITGMMLEMDNSELLILLESEGQLKQKVDEALRVLQTRQ